MRAHSTGAIHAHVRVASRTFHVVKRIDGAKSMLECGAEQRRCWWMKTLVHESHQALEAREGRVG